MRAAVVVELDVEAGEILDVGFPHLGDQFLLADFLLPGADHDRRAVRVVGADINAAPPAKFLEANPNIGLQILHEVAQVDVAVGVRQGIGDENATIRHAKSPKKLNRLWMIGHYF